MKEGLLGQFLLGKIGARADQEILIRPNRGLDLVPQLHQKPCGSKSSSGYDPTGNSAETGLGAILWPPGCKGRDPPWRFELGRRERMP